MTETLPPTISIIVPVYNTEKYLPKCIESILKQTYSDFELLLIDDGSTDKSGEMCDKYKKQDDRIHVYHKHNSGQGSARNLGLEKVKGKYIAFVDSDDYIEKNMLEHLLFNLRKYDADISCGGVYCKEDKTDYKKHANLLVKNNLEGVELFVRNLYGFNHMPVSKLFKAELFNGVRFLELTGYEDAGTIFKLFIKAKKVVSQEVSLYFYFQRSNSTMRREFSKKDLDRIVAYKEMEDGLKVFTEYKHALEIVTANKIGAIFYVLGSVFTSNIAEKKTIINYCQKESKSTLHSHIKITLKNRLLLHMICFCPYIFGILYKRYH